MERDIRRPVVNRRTQPSTLARHLSSPAKPTVEVLPKTTCDLTTGCVASGEPVRDTPPGCVVKASRLAIAAFLSRGIIWLDFWTPTLTDVGWMDLKKILKKFVPGVGRITFEVQRIFGVFVEMEIEMAIHID